MDMDKERQRCERYFNIIKVRVKKLDEELGVGAMALFPLEFKRLIREAMFRNVVEAIGKATFAPGPGLIPELAQILQIVQDEGGEYQMSTATGSSSDLPEGFLSRFTNFSM